MIRLIIVFIVLFISVLLGLQFSENPGYVLIAFHHWTIETTVWFALLALLLLLFGLHCLWLLCNKLGNIAAFWKAHQQRQHERKILDSSNREAYTLLQQNLYLSSMQELIKNNQAQALDKLMVNLPRKFRNNSILQSEYLHYLIKNNQAEKAEALLRKQLKHSSDNAYIDLYGLCQHNEKQLRFAEGLLKKTGPSATIFLCLGRLSLQQKLWGKAKHYLEKSIELEPSPAAYQALGILYDALNEPEAASRNYKQGLALLG